MTEQIKPSRTKVVIFKKGHVLLVAREVDGLPALILPSGVIGFGNYTSIHDIALKQCGMEIEPLAIEEQLWKEQNILIAKYTCANHSQLWVANGTNYCMFHTPENAIKILLQQSRVSEEYNDEIDMLHLFSTAQAFIQPKTKGNDDGPN